MPIIVQESLHKVIPGPGAPMPSPEVVRDMLSHGITAFDDAIAGDVLELFPGGLASLPSRTDEEIQAVVNDFTGPSAGANYQKARLCLYGTTALVALVDPAHENLWVANLGDCEAGMPPISLFFLLFFTFFFRSCAGPPRLTPPISACNARRRRPAPTSSRGAQLIAQRHQPRGNRTCPARSPGRAGKRDEWPRARHDRPLPMYVSRPHPHRFRVEFKRDTTITGSFIFLPFFSPIHLGFLSHTCQ
jgi:hypothetical protein